MKFNKSTLAVGLAIATTLGIAGQATAGIYAGSRLMIDDLTINFDPQFPTVNEPVIGQFDFTISGNAFLSDSPGGFDSFGNACTGNVAGGTTTCGDGGAGTPVLYANTTLAPADVNGGRTGLDTTPLNTAPYLGPTGGANYASADAIIDSASLVDAVNGIIPGGTATRQIAESEVASADSAFSNTDISSTTSFTYLFSLAEGTEGTLTVSFLANPDLLAQFDDATATDATASANTQFTTKLTSNNATAGAIDVTWSPTFATGTCTDGAVDTNLSISGVGCSAETVAENLNGSVTAPGPLPTSTDDLSREAGTNGGVALTGPADMGFQRYTLVLTGLTAGDYALVLNGKTASSVTRVQAVPEPSMLLLLGTGLALVGVRRRKARTA